MLLGKRELLNYEFNLPNGFSLVCCSPWGHRGSDMTERLNWMVLG